MTDQKDTTVSTERLRRKAAELAERIWWDLDEVRRETKLTDVWAMWAERAGDEIIAFSSACQPTPIEPVAVTEAMVERAARAIASTAYDGIYFTTRSREQYVEAEWKVHQTDARTALTAALQVKT